VIEPLLKLGSQHKLIRASVLGALGGGVMWGILGGNLTDTLAGMVFGIFGGPLVQWSVDRKERREAAKTQPPTPPPSPLTSEEQAVVNEYFSAGANRWRRWIAWTLPVAAAVAGLIVAVLLGADGEMRLIGAMLGFIAGLRLGAQFFSAGAYLKSRNPSGRPQY
jgi:hypothetical protein